LACVLAQAKPSLGKTLPRKNLPRKREYYRVTPQGYPSVVYDRVTYEDAQKYWHEDCFEPILCVRN